MGTSTISGMGPIGPVKWSRCFCRCEETARQRRGSSSDCQRDIVMSPEGSWRTGRVAVGARIESCPRTRFMTRPGKPTTEESFPISVPGVRGRGVHRSESLRQARRLPAVQPASTNYSTRLGIRFSPSSTESSDNVPSSVGKGRGRRVWDPSRDSDRLNSC